jgi:hypothetical protein
VLAALAAACLTRARCRTLLADTFGGWSAGVGQSDGVGGGSPLRRLQSEEEGVAVIQQVDEEVAAAAEAAEAEEEEAAEAAEAAEAEAEEPPQEPEEEPQPAADAAPESPQVRLPVPVMPRGRASIPDPGGHDLAPAAGGGAPATVRAAGAADNGCRRDHRGLAPPAGGAQRTPCLRRGRTRTGRPMSQSGRCWRAKRPGELSGGPAGGGGGQHRWDRA